MLIALVLLLALGAAQPTPPPPAAPERVVAVGDIHGDLQSALAVLRLAQLVDEAGHWSGGRAWLVQTGDITDRGPDSRGVIALLRRLQAEAVRAGGRVVPLLGNHEVMNMRGDLRYVSAEDTASYGGAAARAVAFAPDGEDGRWLRTLDAVAEVAGTVFLHGGLTAQWAKVGLPAINAQVRAAIDGGPPEVLAREGPLWYRGYLQAEDDAACAEVRAVLAITDARRIVVGHTPQKDGRISVRCGGQLFGIDTGLSTGYGRHLAALEIRGETVRSIYPP